MEENHLNRAKLIAGREARGKDVFPALQLWGITGRSSAYLDTTRRVMGQKRQLPAELLCSWLCGKGSLAQILFLSFREQVSAAGGREQADPVLALPSWPRAFA